MKKFQIKTYQILSEKINPQQHVRLVFLSDLHSLCFGEGNAHLIQAIEAARPDMVLVGGDMMIGEPSPHLETARELLALLVKKFPVYYAFGNHEHRLMEQPEVYGKEFPKFCEYLKRQGVVFLLNRKVRVDTGAGSSLFLWGWDAPRRFYRKLRPVSVEASDLSKALGSPSEEGYHILMAHNPQFGDAYFSWGADLTLCGHYHGGVWRFSENRGLIAPNFHLFPAYCCGLFSKGAQRMVVSPGLGEHTLRLRIHNPRELIVIELRHGGDV